MRAFGCSCLPCDFLILLAALHGIGGRARGLRCGYYRVTRRGAFVKTARRAFRATQNKYEG